jgi:hypothetical protein
MTRTTMRTLEPVPAWASCKWLPKCHGATAVRNLWTDLDLWTPPLWRALHLPKYSYRYPCDGCPILTSRQETAA